MKVQTNVKAGTVALITPGLIALPVTVPAHFPQLLK
jgi:hypothetical protein